MRVAKVFIVFVLILSLLAFFLTFILFTTRENEKMKRISVEEDNATLAATLTESKSKLQELQSTIDKYSEDFKVIREKRDALILEKQTLTTEIDTIKQNLETANDNLKIAKKEFAEYKVKTADIVNDFKEQNEKLYLKIEEYKKKLSSLDAVEAAPAGFGMGGNNMAIDGGSKQGVVLPKVVVTPQAFKTGKIVVVNRKYKFFILNLGSENEINLNDKVGVFRNDIMIAAGNVEKVYDTLAASSIEKEKEGISIREGDIVKVMK